MAHRVRARHPWRTAALAGTASYLDAGALVTTGIAVSTLYADGMGLSDGVIGALLGLQTLAFAAGALVGGRLGDRLGRRRVLTSSLLLYAVGVAALAAAPGPGILVVGVVASGLALGADLPVSLALIAEQSPEGSKGRLVAASQLLWVAGIVVSSALTAALAPLGVVGGRLAFVHLLVVSLGVLALRLRLRESVEWAAARRTVDDRRAGTARFSHLGQLVRRPLLAPVLATGLYYACWNLGANTLGQFGPFLWVELTGGSVTTASLVGLVGLPLSVVVAVAFLRVVDTPSRQRWVRVGSLLTVVAWAVPVVLGPTQPALLALSVLFGLGAAASGEVVYKVWAQELVPTLLRSSAQGVTLAAARVLAAAAAVATPSLALSRPDLLFGLALGLSVVAAAVGLWWVPRLPSARRLEEPPVVVVGDAAPAS